MDTKQLIELLGGRQKVMADTGLTAGRISQWVTGDHVPAVWLKYFQAVRPDLPWDQYQQQA